jgi:hypothetical protein
MPPVANPPAINTITINAVSFRLLTPDRGGFAFSERACFFGSEDERRRDRFDIGQSFGTM